MYSFKQSVVALVGVLVLFVTFVPLVSRGQGNSSPSFDVNVINTAAAPVPVRDIDNGRQPFQMETNVELPIGKARGVVSIMQVPSGKRAIIETVTVEVRLDQFEILEGVTLDTTLGNFRLSHHLLVSRQGLSGRGEDIYVGTHSMRAYSDPESLVLVSLGRDRAFTPAFAHFTLIGYFVDVP